MFFFAKDYRTITSEWQGARYFMRYGRELVSKLAISLKKGCGGDRWTTSLHQENRVKSVFEPSRGQSKLGCNTLIHTINNTTAQ